MKIEEDWFALARTGGAATRTLSARQTLRARPMGERCVRESYTHDGQSDGRLSLPLPQNRWRRRGGSCLLRRCTMLAWPPSGWMSWWTRERAAACSRRAVQWQRRGGDRNGGRLRVGGGGRRHGEGVPHCSVGVGIAFYAVLHLLRAIKTYYGPRRVCQMKSTRLSSSPLLRCPMLRRLGQYVGVLKIQRKLTQNAAS